MESHGPDDKAAKGGNPQKGERCGNVRKTRESDDDERRTRSLHFGFGHVTLTELFISALYM